MGGDRYSPGNEVSRFEGPSINARRAERGGRVLGRGLAARSPPARGSLWECCKLLQRGLGRSPAEIEFGASKGLNIFFCENQLTNFVQFAKQRKYRQHKATQEVRPVGVKAHPKLKAFWSQSSDNPKHSKQTVTTTTTTQCYVENITSDAT